MIPARFDYVRARDVADAIRLLELHGDDAKLLAGGHSLIPMMKLRLAMPGTLIDLGGISGLAGITSSNDGIRIGAMTTHAALAADPVVAERAPALADAARHLGDPQVRNRGTIGGACAHGDPSADYPAVMLALDAVFTLTGRDGARAVRADDFFRGMFETALDPSEILTAIACAPARQSAYIKYPHPASGYPVTGVAAWLDVSNSAIDAARVAVTGIGDAPFRAFAVERALAGVRIDDSDAIAAAVVGTADAVDARGDTFASAEYRVAMADVFAERAIRAAIGRIGRGAPGRG